MSQGLKYPEGRLCGTRNVLFPVLDAVLWKTAIFTVPKIRTNDACLNHRKLLHGFPQPLKDRLHTSVFGFTPQTSIPCAHKCK